MLVVQRITIDDYISLNESHNRTQSKRRLGLIGFGLGFGRSLASGQTRTRRLAEAAESKLIAIQSGERARPCRDRRQSIECKRPQRECECECEC